MKVTFSKEELQKPSVRSALVALIGNAPKSSFIHIKRFQSKGGHGELQDATYCKGVSYGNSVKNSISMLDEIRDNPTFSVVVTRGVWKDEDGNISPTNRKSKVFSIAGKETATFSQGDVELNEAIAKLYKSLIAPAPPTKDYKSLGNGIYEDEGGTLYMRDLRFVSNDKDKYKKENEKVKHPHKAQAEINAIVDALKKDMPVGNYRTFRLDAIFLGLAIDGSELKPDAEIMGKIEQAKVKVTATVETEDKEIDWSERYPHPQS